MALTRIKKEAVTKEVSELLATSKMTVVATYQGTPVKAMQALRKQGQENGTTLKVVKNRLLRKAIETNSVLKAADTQALKGMLLYAFNSEDEVAPAQTIAQFAKTQPTLTFVGAVTAEGEFLSADAVKALADLPSKPQLIAGVIHTLQSPVRGVMGGLQGNLHGLLDALAAKATN